MTEHIEQAAGPVADAEGGVAVAGAGVSTASGIPDFRSDGGIWDQYDPAEFHYSRFKAEPGPFWERRLEMYDAVYGEEVAPNAAHEALAEMEAAGLLDAVITQNIDGLHADAGSESVIEVHGNGQRVACEDCGRRLGLDPVRERVESGELPPRCESCSGVLKPDVVLFGEQLPTAALQSAKERARAADVFLAAGSSLTVEPVASLPRIAERNGATLVIVNLEETPVSGLAEYDIRADVTEALPALAGAAA
jgi:NAD-dependent deacetylase